MTWMNLKPTSMIQLKKWRMVLLLPIKRASVRTVATNMEDALCNVGGKMYTTSQGITSNIMNHLKVKHSKVPSCQFKVCYKVKIRRIENWPVDRHSRMPFICEY